MLKSTNNFKKNPSQSQPHDLLHERGAVPAFVERVASVSQHGGVAEVADRRPVRDIAVEHCQTAFLGFHPDGRLITVMKTDVWSI